MTLSFPVAPMKATLGTLPPEDGGWAYEVKWDGYRTLAFVEDGRVRLQSSQPARRDRALPGDAGRWPTSSAGSGRCSTVSWSCSTTAAGRASS